MGKEKDREKDKAQTAIAGEKNAIEKTLLAMARPQMSPRELLKAARKAHPDASKKDIVRAAFRSLIAVADSDIDTARALQNFALQERAIDDV